ncbi:MAG: CRISPR-associated endonuclease Cas2 [Erysipelotrichia bacterium]|nr:CRISPR-associated endonuclease Cas2 [Erysipelotrichia bacterium]
MKGMFYIICYDSPSNKRRTKLHKMLKNYAVSVQKSVFETFLDGPGFDKMMQKIYALMDSSVDSVRVYGLSRSAQHQMHVLGFPGRLKDPDFYFIRLPGQSDQVNRQIIDTDPDDEELPDWL